MFADDQAPLVQALDGVHRAAEQLGGVVSGVHPGIRILAVPENDPQRQSIEWLRMRLFALVLLGSTVTVCLVVWLFLRRKEKS